MKFGTKRVFKGSNSEFNNCFLNLVPKIPFFDKFGPETVNSFLKIRQTLTTFWGKMWS